VILSLIAFVLALVLFFFSVTNVKETVELALLGAALFVAASLT